MSDCDDTSPKSKFHPMACSHEPRSVNYSGGNDCLGESVT